MIPADTDLVFGRGTLRLPTPEHVEVVREAAIGKAPRCFRKRFVALPGADFRPWTERERRLLGELGRHPDAAVARLGPRAEDDIDEDEVSAAVLRTYDAGPTVDQWATRVVLRRAGKRLDNLFEDCACWWALTRGCLLALEPLHALGFVHLDLKADNVCIPWPRGASDYPVPGQQMLPSFDELTLIDVAFSLLPSVPLPGPLPLSREPDFEYQSPRLLRALDEARAGDITLLQSLDWRTDLFSLAALLWRYLPEPEQATRNGWTTHRHAQAMSFVRLLVEADSAALPDVRPHHALIALADLRLREPELVAALQADCTFDSERAIAAGADAVPATRMFRPASPLPTAQPAAAAPMPPALESMPFRDEPVGAQAPWTPLPHTPRPRRPMVIGGLVIVALAVAGTGWLIDAPGRRDREAAQMRLSDAVTGARPAASRVEASASALRGPASAPGVARAQPLAPAAVVAAPAASGASVAAASAPTTASREVAAAEAAATASSSASSLAAASAPAPASASASASAPSTSLDSVASDLLQRRLPGLAERAGQRLVPVLATAGQSGPFRAAREVRAKARAARTALEPAALPVSVDSRQARALDDAARAALGREGGAAEALRLQTRAFAADPFDAAVAGNLAAVELRQTPPQSELARRLALHALTLKDKRYPSGRVQDWTSFAVASALTGRDADARSAWAVTLALADDVNRHCNAVVRTQEVYGDALRPSVQALLERARSSSGYARCGAAPATRPSATPPSRSRATAAASARNDARAKRPAARRPAPR